MFSSKQARPLLSTKSCILKRSKPRFYNFWNISSFFCAQKSCLSYGTLPPRLSVRDNYC